MSEKKVKTLLKEIEKLLKEEFKEVKCEYTKKENEQRIDINIDNSDYFSHLAFDEEISDNFIFFFNRAIHPLTLVALTNIICSHVGKLFLPQPYFLVTDREGRTHEYTHEEAEEQYQQSLFDSNVMSLSQYMTIANTNLERSKEEEEDDFTLLMFAPEDDDDGGVVH